MIHTFETLLASYFIFLITFQCVNTQLVLAAIGGNFLKLVASFYLRLFHNLFENPSGTPLVERYK